MYTKCTPNQNWDSVKILNTFLRDKYVKKFKHIYTLKTLIFLNHNTGRLTNCKKKRFFFQYEMTSLIFLNTCEFFQNCFTFLKFLFSIFFLNLTVRSIARKFLEKKVESWYENISNIRIFLFKWKKIKEWKCKKIWVKFISIQRQNKHFN